MQYQSQVNGITKSLTAITASSGIADADKILATNASGEIDLSFVPNGIKNSIPYIGEAPFPRTPVVGDTWMEYVSGVFFEYWFWNGTYWLSVADQDKSIPYTSYSNTTANTHRVNFDQTSNIFLLSACRSSSASIVFSVNDFWTTTLVRLNNAGASTTLSSTVISSPVINTAVFQKTILNLHLVSSTIGFLATTQTRSGAASTLSQATTIFYKKARF